MILPKFPKAQVISFIAFPYAEKLNISGTDVVGYTYEIVKKIEGYTIPIFSDTERDEIYEILTQANIQDKEARKLHDSGVRDLKKILRVK